MSTETLDTLTPFKILLNQHTGLDIAETEQEKLKKILTERLEFFHFSSLEKYCLFLSVDSEKSRAEWQFLVEKITILETFFLRDKGQFELLRHKLLPDLIHRNRHKRSLRIWSAGCSTGEEAYSLALLVQQLIPNHSDWDLLILGTDINQQALAKAQQGVYGRWSFRGVEHEMLQHFQTKGSFLHLNPTTRNMVKFHRVNLLKDHFPNSLIFDMDLIVCRNVFIYFTHDSIKAVLTKFTKTLSKNGYLLTGHGELYQQSLKDLAVLNFPESIVYQRSQTTSFATPSATPLLKPVVFESVLPEKADSTGKSTSNEDSTLSVENLADLCRQSQYQELIKKAKQLMIEQPQNFEAHYWLAKAHANLGNYADAEKNLQSALSINSLFCKAYYLLAHLKELENDFIQAKMLLQKALYIDEKFIPAYLDLSAFYEKEGNTIKSKKMQKNALSLLKSLPSEHYIEECEAKAGDIISQLEVNSLG